MPGCPWCGSSVDVVGNQVGRRDTCSACGHELRACRACRHFDPAVSKACKEPFAEPPADKDSANFCEYYQIGDGGLTAGVEKAALVSAAEALFGKKP